MEFGVFRHHTEILFIQQQYPDPRAVTLQQSCLFVLFWVFFWGGGLLQILNLIAAPKCTGIDSATKLFAQRCSLPLCRAQW